MAAAPRLFEFPAITTAQRNALPPQVFQTLAWINTDTLNLEYSLDGGATFKSLADINGLNAVGTWPVDLDAPTQVKTATILQEDSVTVNRNIVVTKSPGVALDELLDEKYIGSDSIGGLVEYAGLKAIIEDPTNAAYAGGLALFASVPGAPQTEFLRLSGLADQIKALKNIELGGNDVQGVERLTSDKVDGRLFNQNGNTGTLLYTARNLTPASAAASIYSFVGRGLNDAVEDIPYASWVLKTPSIIDGSETSSLTFNILEAGALLEYMTLNGDAKSIDVTPAKLRYNGQVVGASYAPCRTMRVIADATVAIGDLLKPSSTTDFRVVPILTTDSDDAPLIGSALSAGLIGEEIELCGASLLPVRSDALSTIVRGDPVEKSDTENGAVQNTPVSPGTFGAAAQSAAVSTSFLAWTSLNEKF